MKEDLKGCTRERNDGIISPNEDSANTVVRGLPGSLSVQASPRCDMTLPLYYDTVQFRRKDYAVIGVRGSGLFDPAQVGIKPVLITSP